MLCLFSIDKRIFKFIETPPENCRTLSRRKPHFDMISGIMITAAEINTAIIVRIKDTAVFFNEILRQICFFKRIGGILKVTVASPRNISQLIHLITAHFLIIKVKCVLKCLRKVIIIRYAFFVRIAGKHILNKEFCDIIL